MLSKSHFSLIFLIILLTAIAFRAPKLDMRPMHGDEAVHAIKFGALLEQGDYKYDPHEYHGPTLNYFTLIPAWVSSQTALANVSETTLRYVPLFFGVMILLCLLLLKNGLGWPAILPSALLTAVSPAMVFYSRYYIQEILRVCFAFFAIVCGFRYFQEQRRGWAIAAGACLGLMHATKETWIIFLAAMGISLLVIMLVKGDGIKTSLRNKLRIADMGWAIAAGAIVSILFFSSFFTNPAGIWDSVATYIAYLDRAGGNPWHIHPWYYYLEIMNRFQLNDGPLFSEMLIVLLAIPAIIAAGTGRQIQGVDPILLKFFSMYSLLLLIFFSIIPYKTPWNILGAWQGMIVLAGIGCAALWQWKIPKLVKLGIGVIIIGGFIHLAWQAYLANYEYHASPENPHVYAHPTNDVLAITAEIENIASVHPDSGALYIEAIFPGGDYWPFPWYLRSFSKVGWWGEVKKDMPAAPIILCSPLVEEALVEKLYFHPPPGQRHLYVPMFDHPIEMRPHVEMRAYVRKDLIDLLNQNNN